VASKSNRQRKLERARAERRLARRAEQQRRKRQVQAAIGGAVALIVIALGTTWLLGGFSSKPEPVALPSCTWTPKDLTTESGVTDTGTPPTSGEQRTGTEMLTIKTNLGDIQASSAVLSFADNGAGTGGTLTVSDGTHTANVALVGSFDAAGFHLDPDHALGVVITYSDHLLP